MTAFMYYIARIECLQLYMKNREGKIVDYALEELKSNLETAYLDDVLTAYQYRTLKKLVDSLPEVENDVTD